MLFAAWEGKNEKDIDHHKYDIICCLPDHGMLKTKCR
jgi:hypothetical protein